MKESNKHLKILIIIGILLIIFVSCCYLFFHQATGNFTSDLASHIGAALNPNSSSYTITKPIYFIIYHYLYGNFGISIFLAGIIIFTIFVSYKLLRLYSKKTNWFILFLFAILINFIIAIRIKAITPSWNFGLQEATEWHNSTFICMKFLGILVVYYYFIIDSNYLKKMNIKNYIIFTILLILVNLTKPSFILIFAPAMLVALIIDFIKNKKNFNNLRQIILFGIPVLISCLILLYQYKVLYTGDDNSGIALGFMNILKLYHPYPLISILQSIAFPLYILINNFKAEIKDRKNYFAWLMWGAGITEYLFLEETGPRALDGNFDFGVCFSLIILFISSIIILLENRKDFKRLIYKYIYYFVAFSLLLLHIIFGLIYFYRLMNGAYYS